jgi:hypothetical protein
MSQERLRKAVDVPNVRFFSHGLGERAIRGQQVSDPQAANAIGFAQALDDCKILVRSNFIL